MRARRVRTVVALVMLPTGSSLRAQTSSGEITGTVTDGSGGVLPGATVTLTNRGTEIARTVTTNSSGNFIFVNVPPGVSILEVELSGFQSAQTEPFTVGVNESLTRSITRGVGASPKRCRSRQRLRCRTPLRPSWAR